MKIKDCFDIERRPIIKGIYYNTEKDEFIAVTFKDKILYYQGKKDNSKIKLTPIIASCFKYIQDPQEIIDDFRENANWLEKTLIKLK